MKIAQPNIIFYSDFIASPWDSGQRRMLALFMTIQHCTGGGGIAIRQEKEVESAKIGKKEAKLYLQELAENPRELTNNA